MESLNELSVNLSEEEIQGMKSSTNLWHDFIPLKYSERCYNVRIGCDFVSFIRISYHQGFNLERHTNEDIISKMDEFWGFKEVEGI